MLRWLGRWGKRAFGVFLCTGSWLIAVGLFSLGRGWFQDTFAIRDPSDLVLHGVVWALGPTGGAVFFFLAGIFALWVFFVEEKATD